MRALMLIVSVVAANLLLAAAPAPSAAIERIVETRSGRQSCWGLVITLDKLSFKKSITTDQLSIREAKHNSDVKDLMAWSVDDSRKKLTILFKPNCGDFGSGNTVEVSISASALAGSQNEDIKLTISTDP
jgi:hypothetical protein